MDDKNKKTDETIENTELQIVAEVQLDEILKQMHQIALSNVSNKEYKITNSAFNDNGELKSAGTHIISATLEKEGKLDKDTAFKSIKEYVQWFNGPDIANTLKIENLQELVNDEEKAKANSEAPTKTEKPTNVADSNIWFPTFKQYLLNEATPELSATEPTANDKTTNTENVVPSYVKGYYIVYELNIDGIKSTPLSDAVKSMATGLLKGIGFKRFNWATGASGKEWTLGDLANSLEDTFGQINPDELKTRFNKNYKSKFPQSTQINEIYDKQTILKFMKTKLTSTDKKMIDRADFSFAVRVLNTDKSAKLIQKNVIADLITQSIKGIFKKFDNKLTNKDIIQVNDYIETQKSKDKPARDVKTELYANSGNTTKSTEKTDTASTDSTADNTTISKTINASIEKTYQFMTMLYDDIDYSTIKDIILEKSNSQQNQDHLTNEEAKALISAIKSKTLKNIRANKDAIEKKWGEPKAGQNDFKWPGKYQEQYDEFNKLLFSTVDNEKQIIDYINSAINNKSKTAKLQKVVLTRCKHAIKLIKDISNSKDQTNKENTNSDETADEVTGKYLFFIVPMKGLKKDDNTDDEDEGALAGKSK